MDSRFCIICGKELTGRQRKLCSEECRRKRTHKYCHDYRQNNPEKIKEISRNNYQNNRAERLRYKSEYYQNNQDKIKKYSGEYYQNNRELICKKYRRVRGLPEDCDLYNESSIECIMRKWLQENNIDFIAQYYINFENSTWTYVDFYISKMNVCLYCDGGYYHLLPKAKKCEAEQNKILPQMGYSVIRMTGDEILAGDRPWELI